MAATNMSGTRAAWARLRPSIPQAVGAILIALMPLAYGRRWLAMDGDPARHIRVGETILRSGIFHHDPFSFTKAGAYFVPYEWLSEVLAALSVRAAGLPGLLVLTGAILGLTYAIVTYTLLRRGVRPLHAAVVLLLVMAIGIVHWQARPHVVTLLGAAVLMALIDRASRLGTDGPRRSAWASAWPMLPVFALWANLHGGFLYGLAVLAAVVVGDRLEMLNAAGGDRDAWRGKLIRHAAMLGVAALASLMTPNGPHLYSYTLRTLRDAYLIDHTFEFMSPDFHTLRFALIAIVLVVIGLALVPRRPRFPTLALAGLSLGAALMSVRNLPLLGIVVLPLIAEELEPVLPRWAHHTPQGNRGPVNVGRLGFLWPVIITILMFWLGRISEQSGPAPRGLTALLHRRLPTEFDSTAFPVRAVRAARAAGVSGRIFHSFTWGGYLLYAWPEQRVFIDGQTDFYGDSITREYSAITGLDPGWRGKLAAWRIDLVLMETRSPLAEALVHDAGWRPIFCDSTAVFVARDSMRGPALDRWSSLANGCASLPISPLPAGVAEAGASRSP